MFSAVNSTSPSTSFLAVLTGNPNCGKTTIFNALTGLRGRVGNYAGVTVERKEGVLLGASSGTEVKVLDLPGTYSLSPQSLDEQIARDVLLRRLPEIPAPSLVIVVVDASNLQRNLYFATQVLELGYPTFIALNMMDVASDQGIGIDCHALSKALGVPVFPMMASRGTGVQSLNDAIRKQSDFTRKSESMGKRVPRQFLELPELFGQEASRLVEIVSQANPARSGLAAVEGLLLLTDSTIAHSRDVDPLVVSEVEASRARLESAGIDWRSVAIESRYARAAAIQMAVTQELAPPSETWSDRLDLVLTHRIWGVVIFIGLMAIMFQSIFTLAEIPKGWIESLIGWVGNQVEAWIEPGALSSLLQAGVIRGVGSVITFLPQICLLFLFISLLEDTGYMARAAFLMDRVMSRVGLHGKSFIPMLSSFACAIPGIMATRTIESPKDRLVTILVAPLMSCSARLPVYSVLIAACIPPRKLWGWLGFPGLTLLAMYLLGIFGALGMAWLLKRTFFRGDPSPMILELPPYKLPVLKVVLRHMWDRSKLFLRRAGTVILGINILLWFLASYPKSAGVTGQFNEERLAAVHAALGDGSSPESDAATLTVFQKLDSAALHTGSNRPPVEVSGRILPSELVDQLQDQLRRSHLKEAGERLRTSYAGWLGRFIEPVIRPLGFDWKIGIGLITSFAAREVFVSTMSVVYNVGGADSKGSSTAGNLAEIMRDERFPNGASVYTTLTGVTLMVFYVFAMQCVSTLAITRRETNSWSWTFFQWFYMTGLAWVIAFFCHQTGRWMGLG